MQAPTRETGKQQLTLWNIEEFIGSCQLNGPSQPANWAPQSSVEHPSDDISLQLLGFRWYLKVTKRVGDEALIELDNTSKKIKIGEKSRGPPNGVYHHLAHKDLVENEGGWRFSSPTSAVLRDSSLLARDGVPITGPHYYCFPCQTKKNNWSEMATETQNMRHLLKDWGHCKPHQQMMS